MFNQSGIEGITYGELEMLNPGLAKSKDVQSMVVFHRQFIDSLMTLDQSVREGKDKNDPNYWDEIYFRDSLYVVVFINFTRKYGVSGRLNTGCDQNVSNYLL